MIPERFQPYQNVKSCLVFTILWSELSKIESFSQYLTSQLNCSWKIFSANDFFLILIFCTFKGYETWTFCSQMPWLPWRKLWREIKSVWTTVSWLVLALHHRRGKITWRGWRLQETMPGSIAHRWRSLQDRSAGGWGRPFLPFHLCFYARCFF